MRMKIDRTNKPWNKHISDEEILNTEYSMGYLLQTNLDNPLLCRLAEDILSTYQVTATFTYEGFNGETIRANNQTLVYRNRKDGDFHLGKNVAYINGNLSRKGGGSNKYPSVAYKGAKCTLQFISYGLPVVDQINGWKIKIISLNKIQNYKESTSDKESK